VIEPMPSVGKGWSARRSVGRILAAAEVEAEEAEPGNESPDNGAEKRQPPPAGSKAAL